MNVTAPQELHALYCNNDWNVLHIKKISSRFDIKTFVRTFWTIWVMWMTGRNTLWMQSLLHHVLIWQGCFPHQNISQIWVWTFWTFLSSWSIYHMNAITPYESYASCFNFTGIFSTSKFEMSLTLTFVRPLWTDELAWGDVDICVIFFNFQSGPQSNDLVNMMNCLLCVLILQRYSPHQNPRQVCGWPLSDLLELSN